MLRLPHPPKFYQALREASVRAETGLYIIEGPKLIQEALQSLPVEAFHAILWREEEEPPAVVPAQLLYRVPAWLLTRITTLQTAPAGIAVAYQKAHQPSAQAPALFLEGLQDPGNVGTLLRLAEWFGLSTVYLSAESVDPFHPKVVRASMGSLFRLSVMRMAAWKALLEVHPKPIVVATLRGMPPEQVPWNAVQGLYLGQEGQGVRHSPTDAINVTIPKAPTVRAESLNVAVAASILLYLWRRPTQG
jgi:TrmH family RNA methyltransferase